MSISRRTVLTAALSVAYVTPLRALPLRVFTPEEFGAKGDGVADDSIAMARLAAAVSLYGGGTVNFRRTTYRVGRQGLQLTGGYMFPPQDLLVFKGCRFALTLNGNGARLRCAPGLRYGAFDADGKRADHPMPYLGGGLATPYFAMIHVEDCSGPVSIADFDLEGPGDAIVLGGQYGDTGWQIPAIGLVLRNNRGGESVARVATHGHPQDGMLIDGLDADTPGATRAIRNVVARRNGRQGCSIVGGRGYRFAQCSFLETGRGKVRSAPGAGVDIEAEAGKRIRDLAFAQCRFADNDGCGMVANTGDSEGVRFDECTFVGTTSWSAWPNKPDFRFARCTFVGAVVRAWGDTDPARAAHFTACTFTDNPARSPTKQVYGGTNQDRPLADLSDARNVTFAHCTFTALRGVLPWSTGAIYRDCTMTQGMTTFGFPRGRFEGANTITGRVNLADSKIAGTVILNGKRVGS